MVSRSQPRRGRDTKIILERDIDWDEVRKEINSQVRSSPSLLPQEFTPYLELNKQKDTG